MLTKSCTQVNSFSVDQNFKLFLSNNIKQVKYLINLYVPIGQASSKKGLRKSDVLELVWYIYIPKAAGLPSMRQSTWLNPIIDGVEARKLIGMYHTVIKLIGMYHTVTKLIGMYHTVIKLIGMYHTVTKLIGHLFTNHVFYYWTFIHQSCVLLLDIYSPIMCLIIGHLFTNHVFYYWTFIHQ